MGIFTLKRKYFSKYDETDNLKRMKDSDILAEKPKESNPSILPTAVAAGAGALGGAAIGAVAGGIRGLGKYAKAVKKVEAGTAGLRATKIANAGRSATALSGLKKGGYAGALLGGGILLANAMKKRRKEAEANEFYNNRLEYAQRQARRREKKDWKENMTQRDGYSY